VCLELLNLPGTPSVKHNILLYVEAATSAFKFSKSLKICFEIEMFFQLLQPRIDHGAFRFAVRH